MEEPLKRFRNTEDTALRIGIVSDTHGHIHNTRQCIAALADAAVERVIHCGDIGSVEVVDLFHHWPTHFVFGNVDHNKFELQTAIESIGQTCHGDFGSVEWDGRKIAFLHSDDRQRFQETIADGGWDLICYGHTHVAKLESINNALVLNPGAVYRATPHTIATVDLSTMEVQHVTLG